MSYPPESWAYVTYLQDIRDNGTQPRRDGLPLFSSQVEPYLSFSREDIGMWEQALGDSDSCIVLFHALEAHDHARPIHASPDHWAAIIRTMPHLKDTLPGEQDSIEQLRKTKGWLPVEFYHGAHRDNALHGIAPILEWCDASNFYHARSKTLKGGPLGCKWAVIMLVHVLRNARLVREHNPMVDAHYGTMPCGVEFPDTYIEDLHKSVNGLLAALEESTGRLCRMVEERGTEDPVSRAHLEVKRCHANFVFASRDAWQAEAKVVDNLWQDHQARPPSPDRWQVVDVEMQDAGGKPDDSRPYTPSSRAKGKQAKRPRRAPKCPLSGGGRSITGHAAKEQRVQFHADQATETSSHESMDLDDLPLNIRGLEISPRTARTSEASLFRSQTSPRSSSGLTMHVKIPVHAKSNKRGKRTSSSETALQ